MTKFITIIGLLGLMATASRAQNRANIKGKVVDSLSDVAMEFATVAVLNQRDSALVSYTTTVKGGEFNLHNLPSGVPLKLVISFVGYNNFRKSLILDKGAMFDAGTIKMSSKTSTLNEVKIHADVIPIIIKKDTIEFSAEAFKTPPNAVVEELLKRLPGIQVDMDGTISVNGKKVKKLLIDGKQFFTNDPRIASKNLDAALIDKIQVYDDREDDPDHLIPDARVDKIINLKLKSAIKKSTGGKLHGGPGTRDTYDAGILYNMFRDTLQISLIGVSNNLNRTGFTNGDLTSLGGFNRSGNDALNGLATGGRSGGIQTFASTGLNINTDYGKKLKINLLYYYSYTSTVYNSTVFQQQFLGDTTLSTNATSNYHSVNNKHNVSGLVEMNPDTNTRIRYQPKFNFNADNYTSGNDNFNFSNLLPRLNSSTNISDSRSDNTQFQHTFSYYRKLRKKGETLTINHSLNINPGSGTAYSINDFTSYTTQLPSSNLNRLNDNARNTSDGSLGVTYRLPFNKKITGDVMVSGNFNRNNGRTVMYNFDPKTGQYNMYIDSLSRNLVRRQFAETIRPELTYKISKTTILIGNLSIKLMQVYNNFNRNVPDINRFDTFLLPSINLSANSFSFSYDQSVSQPSIEDLQPYSTFGSQLYSSAGNPLLKPTRSHNFNFNLYVNKSEKQLSTNIYSNFTYDENSIFTESKVSSQGATFNSPVNKTGAYSGSLGGGFFKGFKKIGNWQIRLNTNIYSYLRHEFFQVNNNEGFQNTVSTSINQAIFANWNNKVEISPTYNVSPSITTYQNLTYNTVKYVRQSLNIPVVIKWLKRTTFEANYNYTYNPLVAAGFQRSMNILNLSVARQFQYRDRGEIKLACFDLFDQSISAYRYASGNHVTDVQTQVLKRYFLITYAYRFTSTVTKDKKK